MWRRWKAGYSIREICQALKRNSSPVHAQLAIRGGHRSAWAHPGSGSNWPEREESPAVWAQASRFASIARR